MNYKKGKRFIALGLAAAQLVPLTAVITNVSAFAEDNNGKTAAAETDSAANKKADKIFDSEIKVNVDGNETNAKFYPETNVVEYVYNEATGNKAPADSDANEDVARVKVQLTGKIDTEHIAFANYGPDFAGTTGSKELENITSNTDGSGTVMFYMPNVENYEKTISFRIYDEKVNAVNTDTVNPDPDNEPKNSGHFVIGTGENANPITETKFDNTSETGKKYQFNWVDGAGTVKKTQSITFRCVKTLTDENSTVNPPTVKDVHKLDGSKLPEGTANKQQYIDNSTNWKISYNKSTAKDTAEVTGHFSSMKGSGESARNVALIVELNDEIEVDKLKVSNADGSTAASGTDFTNGIKYLAVIPNETGKTDVKADGASQSETKTGGTGVKTDETVKEKTKYVILWVSAVDGKKVNYKIYNSDNPNKATDFNVTFTERYNVEAAEPAADANYTIGVSGDNKDGDYGYKIGDKVTITVAPKDRFEIKAAPELTVGTTKVMFSRNNGVWSGTYTIKADDIKNVKDNKITLTVKAETDFVRPKPTPSNNTGSVNTGSGAYVYDDTDYSVDDSDYASVDGKTVSSWDVNGAIRNSNKNTVKIDLSSTSTSGTKETKTSVPISTAKAVIDAVNNGGSNKSAEVTFSDDVTLIVDKNTVSTVNSSKSIVIAEQKTPVKPSRKADNTTVRGTAAKSFTAANVGSVKARVDLGSALNGQFANFYKVNAGGRPEYIGTAKIEKGEAAADLNGDGQYIVMASEFSDLNGDADNDGKVNAKDAAEILKQIARIKLADNNDDSVLDVNGDRKINGRDAVCILKRIAGIKN